MSATLLASIAGLPEFLSFFFLAILLLLSTETAVPPVVTTLPAVVMLMSPAAPLLTVAVRTGVVRLVSITVWAEAADPATRASVAVEAKSRRCTNIVPFGCFCLPDGAGTGIPWSLREKCVRCPELFPPSVDDRRGRAQMAHRRGSPRVVPESENMSSDSSSSAARLGPVR